MWRDLNCLLITGRAVNIARTRQGRPSDMRPAKPITRAFCVELQQELSIVAARREYFSQEPPRARFEFLCSSEPCRAQGVKVMGGRYDVKPQDNPTIVAAHLRENGRDDG